MKKLWSVLLAVILLFIIAILPLPVTATPSNDIALPDFVQKFMSVVDGVKLSTLFGLILVNFLTGIAVAIKNKQFNFKEMGDFLLTRVLPYVVGYFAVGIIAVIDPSWVWAVTAVWAVLLATMVGAVLKNLKELGISQIPDFLSGPPTG